VARHYRCVEQHDRNRLDRSGFRRGRQQKKSAGPSRRSQFHSRRLHLAAGLRRLIPFHVGLHTARFGCRHFGSGKAGSCESDGQPNTNDRKTTDHRRRPRAIRRYDGYADRCALDIKLSSNPTRCSGMRARARQFGGEFRMLRASRAHDPCCNAGGQCTRPRDYPQRRPSNLSWFS